MVAAVAREANLAEEEAIKAAAAAKASAPAPAPAPEAGFDVGAALTSFRQFAAGLFGTPAEAPVAAAPAAAAQEAALETIGEDEELEEPVGAPVPVTSTYSEPAPTVPSTPAKSPGITSNRSSPGMTSSRLGNMSMRAGRSAAKGAKAVVGALYY